GLAYILIELFLRYLRLPSPSLSHPGVVEDQIDQHPDPRKNDDKDHPRSFDPARQVVTSKDVDENGDRDPDKEDPRKDDEDVPEDVQEWIRRCSDQQAGSPPVVRFEALVSVRRPEGCHPAAAVASPRRDEGPRLDDTIRQG